MKIIEDPNKRSPHWRSKWEKDKSLWERNIDIIFSFYRGNQSQHSTALCNTFRGKDVRHLLLLRGTMLTGRAILSFFQGRFFDAQDHLMIQPTQSLQEFCIVCFSFHCCNFALLVLAILEYRNPEVKKVIDWALWKAILCQLADSETKWHKDATMIMSLWQFNLMRGPDFKQLCIADHSRMANSSSCSHLMDTSPMTISVHLLHGVQWTERFR